MFSWLFLPGMTVMGSSIDLLSTLELILPQPLKFFTSVEAAKNINSMLKKSMLRHWPASSPESKVEPSNNTLNLLRFPSQMTSPSRWLLERTTKRLSSIPTNKSSLNSMPHGVDIASISFLTTKRLLDSFKITPTSSSLRSTPLKTRFRASISKASPLLNSSEKTNQLSPLISTASELPKESSTGSVSTLSMNGLIPKLLPPPTRSKSTKNSCDTKTYSLSYRLYQAYQNINHLIKNQIEFFCSIKTMIRSINSYFLPLSFSPLSLRYCLS